MHGHWRLLASALLLTGAWSTPVNTPRAALVKRTDPQIDSAFSEQQKKQLTDGFHDAVQLASFAIDIIDTDIDPALFLDKYHDRGHVFKKYFDPKDSDLVRKVFLAILGNPRDLTRLDWTGSAKLGGLKIVPDYEDEDGELACDGATMAELREWDTDNPKLVMCDAGFGHGGIAKEYDGVPSIDCEYMGERVSWKMDTMGSILLHEYTHFKNLVSPPLSKETDDDAYGPTGTRNIDKKIATNNADSYSWFANEAMWSILCTKDFGDPKPEDDDDPNCDGTVCKATKGSP